MFEINKCFQIITISSNEYLNRNWNKTVSRTDVGCNKIDTIQILAVAYINNRFYCIKNIFRMLCQFHNFSISDPRYQKTFFFFIS